MRIPAAALFVLLAGCSAMMGEAPEDPTDDAAPDDGLDPMDPEVEEGDLPITARYRELADRIEAERLTKGAPGVSVLMMEHGRVVFAHGFGLREPDGTALADSRTLYRIGSLTKSMTTAALLELVDAGQVALTDRVSDHIADLNFAYNPNIEDQITIEQLLTHQSGLDDYYWPANAPFAESSLSSTVTGAYAQAAYLQSPIGAFYNYSNPNFSLAGLVIERASGIPHRTEITQTVFEPLGMARTLWTGDEAVADGNAAWGLTESETGARLVQRPDAYDNAFVGAAGMVWSSPWDLARYITFFIDGDDRVLSDELREAMQTPQVDTDLYGDLDNYGYGLGVARGIDHASGYRDVKVVSHTGAINGFSAEMTWVPSTGYAFIVLANTDDAYFYDTGAYAIAEFGDLPAPSARPTNLDVDPSRYGEYTGTYTDANWVGRIDVTQEGGNLVVSLPDLDAQNVTYDRVLEPWALDNFGLTIDGYQDGLTFVRDASGAVQYFRARYLVGTRGSQATRPVDPDRLRAHMRAKLAEPWTSRPYRRF